MTSWTNEDNFESGVREILLDGFESQLSSKNIFKE